MIDKISPLNYQFSKSGFKSFHLLMCQQDGEGYWRVKRTLDHRPFKEQQCVGDPWHYKSTRSVGCLKRKECCEALQHNTLKCLICAFWGNIKKWWLWLFFVTDNSIWYQICLFEAGPVWNKQLCIKTKIFFQGATRKAQDIKGLIIITAQT